MKERRPFTTRNREVNRRRSWCVFQAVMLGVAIAVNASAEIVFQDFFTHPATNLTNSAPWIDVQGNGWQADGSGSQLVLDGGGHVYNSATSAGTSVGVPLIPIGPHGSLTASATMELPVGSTEWIGLGFADSNSFLSANGSGSGPWLQVQGNGNMTLYGGAGLNNATTVATAFTNNGNPVQIFLTTDAFHGTASAGTMGGGITNFVFDRWPLTNSAGAIIPHYLVLQMSTNLTAPAARWVAGVSVDWLPRPPPMLTLPVPILQTNFVGAPGTNDLLLIQNALAAVYHSTTPTEIRFNAGATYTITNGSLTGGIPLTLYQATNVLVNGNGCKILITNPRLGFLDVHTCSNIIVENFSVDHEPLPFTQGTVTHNFFTNVPSELAIEFLVDTNYPAPTNANYIDLNASNNAERWGTVMSSTNYGRGADNRYSICFYQNVVQTNHNGAFKVYLSYYSQARNVQPGDRWNMIARYDASTVFWTYASHQVTYLNNTNYSAAGLSYGGEFSEMVNEVGDQIQFGPPPLGATAPRLRTSNADGGLFIASRIGPWVQDCNFAGLSDDTANPCIGGFMVTNIPVQPTNVLCVVENGAAGDQPQPLIPFEAEAGDTMLFLNPSNGSVFDRAKVTAFNRTTNVTGVVTNIYSLVTFDRAISNVVTGTFDTNTLLLNRTLNTSAVYLDNTFSNSRQHGIYCRADNMLIAHNTISGMALNAIAGYPVMIPTFLNLFVPTNVVILDNVLSDCGYCTEAISNSIPADEPDFALVAFNQSGTNNLNYVTNDLEISGIRILYNAFLNWRRAPLTLHNVTGVNVIGNYFGLPITNDNLVPLTNDVIADLWASDYPNLVFTNNVNATTITNTKAIHEDGTNTAIENAFQLPSVPKLAAALSGSNVLVSWVSLSPGFVLQQSGKPNGANWTDVTNLPVFAGQSNAVTISFVNNITSQFYRARQR
jgi:hypothetical protein